MDLKGELLVRESNNYTFEDRSDLAYFVGKVIRNWNVVLIFITLMSWLTLAYGLYFRMDYHISDENRHLSTEESVLLDEIGRKDVINRLNIIERRLAIVEKLIELGYNDPDTLNQIVEAVESAPEIQTLENLPKNN